MNEQNLRLVTELESLWKTRQFHDRMRAVELAKRFAPQLEACDLDVLARGFIARHAAGGASQTKAMHAREFFNWLGGALTSRKAA